MGPYLLCLPRRLGGKQTQTKLPRQHRDRRWEHTCGRTAPESSALARAVRQGAVTGYLVLRQGNHPRHRPPTLVPERAGSSLKGISFTMCGDISAHFFVGVILLIDRVHFLSRRD